MCGSNDEENLPKQMFQSFQTIYEENVGEMGL